MEERSESPVCRTETLEARQLLSSSVIISEIMYHPVPLGTGTEYIELYNPTTSTVNLNGWKFTKGIDFDFGPTDSIAPGGYLVVASNLARFQAKYPNVTNVVGTTLIPEGAPATALVPTDDSLELTWHGRTFDDTGWTGGTTGAGFEAGTGYESLIGLDLESQMHNVNGSAYLRVPFTIENAYAYESLTLRMKYDDGFVAYLNGVEVARRNAPATVAWNSDATANRSDSLAVKYEDIDISPFINTLTAGTNVLAVQLLNDGAGSTDLLMMPVLVSSWKGTLSNSSNEVRIEDATGDNADSVTYADEGDWAQRVRGSFGYEYVTSIAYAGTTATLTVPAHDFNNGDVIQLIDDTGIVDSFTISGVAARTTTVPTANTFNITITAGTTFTGTVVVRTTSLDRGHHGWRYITLADGGGRSLELINPLLDNDSGQNWTASAVANGTPGSANSVASGNIAPMILDVEQDLWVPRSDQSVKITARIVDELGAAGSASVFYRVDGATPPPFTAVAMHDDGKNGDLVAGDGIWTAVLPQQANLAIVEFYVSATDTGGLTRTWPAPTDLGQTANLLYQVDNTAYAGNQPMYRIVMTRAEALELQDIGDTTTDNITEQNSNAQMNATFIAIDGTGADIRYAVGVRNRGHGSRQGYPNNPNNYRINIPSDRTWRGRVETNLNGRTTYTQVLGAAIHQLAGIAAGDAEGVQFRINGVNVGLLSTNLTNYTNNTQGSYAHIEEVNGDWAENHFPEDSGGNVYLNFRWDGNLAYEAELQWEGANPDPYKAKYFKNTNGEAADWSGLIHMIDVLNNAPDATYFEDVSKVVNIAQWTRYLAMDALLLNWETGLNSGIGDDYYMYQGAKDPRFVLLPHDMDTVLGQGNSVPATTTSIFGVIEGNRGNGNGVQGLRRFLSHPDIVKMYYQAFVDLINTVFNPAVMNPLIDQVVGGWVPASVMTAMKTFVVNRTTGVLAQIPQQFTTSLTLSQNANGQYVATGPTASLSGTANVTTTRSVMVNDQPVTWIPRTGAWNTGSTTQTFIAKGANWKYLDNGSDQGTGWIADGYNDSAWKSGNAELGYGDNDEVTTVGYIDTDPVTAGVQKNITTYFRRTFNVDSLTGLSAVTMSLKYDDGAVIYINGNPVPAQRINMPTGTIGYQTPASGNTPSETTYFTFTIDPALLHAGTNTIAVEIHQESNSSTDISFDMQLDATYVNGGIPLSAGVNRLRVRAFDGPAGTGNVVNEGFVDVVYAPGTTWTETPREVASLEMMTADAYRPGDSLYLQLTALDNAGKPQREIWDLPVTLTTDNPNITITPSTMTLRNGFASILATIGGTGSGTFTITATAGGKVVNRTLTSLAGAPKTTVSGTLSGNTTWSGIVHVTGDVTVPAGATLTINPGTQVLLNGISGTGTTGTDLIVLGAVQSLGTLDHPVVFTSYDPATNWGQVYHNASSSASLYQYTIFTKAGRSPSPGGHSNTGPVFLATNSTVVFDHASITDNPGKVMHSSGSNLTFRRSHMGRSWMGPEIGSTALLMEDTFVYDMRPSDGRAADDNDGIYLHSQQAGQTIRIVGGAFGFVPDDGIDTLGSTITLEDLVVRDTGDKGISAFDGVTNVIGSVVADCGLVPEDGASTAISAKANDGKTVTVNIDHSTIVSATVGIQAKDKSGIANDTVIYNVTNSVIVAPDPVQLDLTNPITVVQFNISYTNTFGEATTGTGNLNADPLFIDAAAHDYRLGTGSPSINTGNAASANDPDGTRADQGRLRPGVTSGGETVIAAGTLTADLTLTAAGGPYHVTGDVVAPAGVTVTIQPGVTVYFDAGTGFTFSGGRLVAEGTDASRIRFTRYGTTGTWDGLQFSGSMLDNRISWAIIEYGTGPDNTGMVGLTDSKITIDRCYFANTDRRRIRAQNSVLVVRNSEFTDIFPGATAPNANNLAEHIWGRAALSGGQCIIENNIFGTTKGHNDAVDFDGGLASAGNPLVIIRNNYFKGGGDDAMDLEGDMLIEGNIITNFIKDQWNTDPGNSNGISAGDADDVGHTYTVVGNVFYNIQHAVQAKDQTFLNFLNNTVVNGSQPAIYFLAPDADPAVAINYGRGAYLDGNIFQNVASIVGSLGPTTTVTINRSIAPAAFHTYGTGNIDADARLVNPAAMNFALRAGSPAFGTGPNGLNMGSEVSLGASISGEPRSVTGRHSATLTVGGPAITHYKYRVNGGAWSAETAVADPIVLGSLADGTYTVQVIGKNVAGVWQSESSPTTSRSWTVVPGPYVVINEVLAQNTTTESYGGTYPDLVELYNDSDVPANLADMSMTENNDLPRKYVFPAGTILNPGAYLKVYADTVATPPAGELHIGFGLRREGDQLYLYDTLANGGGLVDSVKFGQQLADRSIGRMADGSWTLNTPTIGGANVAVRLGDASLVKINEWLAAQEVAFTEDFIELKNGDALPVALGGLYLSDHPASLAHRAYLHGLDPRWDMPNAIDPLSFVAGSGYVVFKADNQNGQDHLSFALAHEQGILRLADAQFRPIDTVFYLSQKTDVSQGRDPYTPTTYPSYTIPTPGTGNPGVTTTSGTPQTYNIFGENHVWRYEDTGTNLGTTWLASNYNDSGWKQGAATLYWRYSAQITYNTLLGHSPTSQSGYTDRYIPWDTYYFRSTFTYEGDPTMVTSIQLRAIVDDGAYFYLNGVPLYQIRMAATPLPTYSTRATKPPTSAPAYIDYTIPASSIPAGALKAGLNVLQVEVHQDDGTSSDIAFGTSLVISGTSGTTTEYSDPIPARHFDLMDQLRVTEVMYAPIGGGDYEYIEFKNIGATPLDLGGVRISGGVDYTFPAGTTVAADGYVLVVANSAKFIQRYGIGKPVAGQYSGKLDNGGESIVLKLPAPYDAAILRFDYTPNWYPTTNGTGPSLVISDPLQARNTWGSKRSWRPSLYAGGSPGAADVNTDPTALPVGTIVINEVMPSGGGAWIELHNTTAEEVPVAGWYLSNDQANLTKYQIPASLPGGTTIAPYGYLVLYASLTFGNAANPGVSEAFDFSTLQAVYLTSQATGGGPGGYREAATFGALETGLSYGRFGTSVGVAFPALSQTTVGETNAYPRVGPVIINEIMYQPAAGSEYIELRNTGTTAAALHDGTTGWAFTDGVTFAFPAGAEIAAGGYALVVGIDPITFRNLYGIPAGVPIYGPYSGDLDNAGERLELSRPLSPLTFAVADVVHYDNTVPWPSAPDNGGPSLSRRFGDDYGDDAINWAADVDGGTPGRANFQRAMVGSASGDIWYLRVSGGMLQIFTSYPPEAGAVPWQAFPLSDISALRIDGGSGNDTMVLATDMPFTPVFNGGIGQNLLEIRAGTRIFDTDLSAGSQGLAVVVTGAGTTVDFAANQHLANLSIGASSILHLAGAQVLRTGGLSVAEGGLLDVGAGALVIDAADPAAALAAITPLITAGYNGGTWDGESGIASSAAASDAKLATGLAAIVNADSAGSIILGAIGAEVLGTSSVVVRYTYNGDADVDGNIDSSDYFFIDRGTLTGGTGYRGGDFNYDAAIDIDDYALIDWAFLHQGAKKSAKAISAVATPTATAVPTAAAATTTTSSVANATTTTTRLAAAPASQTTRPATTEKKAAAEKPTSLLKSLFDWRARKRVAKR